jgi:hypothetical protein
VIEIEGVEGRVWVWKVRIDEWRESLSGDGEKVE